MEYCYKGDISQLIKKCKKTNDPIGEEVIWKIFIQILLALHICHSRPNGKILNRDINPGNVFLDSQENVKLGNFGLSKILAQNSEYATTHVGTPGKITAIKQELKILSSVSKRTDGRLDEIENKFSLLLNEVKSQFDRQESMRSQGFENIERAISKQSSAIFAIQDRLN